MTGKKKTRPDAVEIDVLPDHPWDRAAQLTLNRECPRAPGYSAIPLEPGVNYFVLQLERLGVKTHFSCQGHPSGFYITFECSEAIARRIHSCGFFNVEVERGENYWSLRKNTPTENDLERIKVMRWAAEAWENNLGPLDIPKKTRRPPTKPRSSTAKMRSG